MGRRRAFPPEKDASGCSVLPFSQLNLRKLSLDEAQYMKIFSGMDISEHPEIAKEIDLNRQELFDSIFSRLHDE